MVTYDLGNGICDMTNLSSDSVSIMGSSPPPLEDFMDSGNNINVRVQENSGSNIGRQSGRNGEMYSDFPIFQGQSTDQDSNVVS